MYNVLIVDDEQLMLKYLTNSIPSLCSNFQVTGSATDGLEAIDLIKKQSFDLVITDIRMPEVDGLALIKYIYERSPLTKIITISGYNEFEYARTAIKYQVTDYLLKPLSDDSLKEVLWRVSDQLDQAQPSKYQVICDSISNMEPRLLKQKLLSAILDGDSNLIYLLFSEFDKQEEVLTDTYYAIIIFSIDEIKLQLQVNNSLEISSFHLKLNQICTQYCIKNNITGLYANNGNSLLLIDAPSKVALEEMYLSIYDTINKSAMLSGMPKIIASLGSSVKDILNLSVSAQDAERSLVLSLKKVEAPFIPSTAIEHKVFLDELDVISNKIYTDYISHSTQNLYVDIRHYCDLFANEINNSLLLRFGSYIIRYICQRSAIKNKYINLSYKRLTENINQLILQGVPSYEDAVQTITFALEPLFEIIQQPVVSPAEQIVENAKKYILSHYNEPISLSIVADHVGVNSCYLSDLIHKHLGEPYSKYILRIRMTQAARMIKHNPNEKIYQISEKTGFVSTKHFISVFKKYYGVTPTNYNSGK